MTPGSSVNGGLTVLKYAACALGMAGASTGLGIISAIVACSMLLYQSEDVPAGGET